MLNLPGPPAAPEYAATRQELKDTQYPVEQNRLKKVAGNYLWSLLVDSNAIIAGGAITSCFTNGEINDLDVYFRNEGDLFRVVAAIFDQEDYTDLECSPFEIMYIGHSARTLMFNQGEQHIQFMTFKYFPDVKDIFETFDFTCCMGAYECGEGKFTLHDNFMKHNSQRHLEFNSGTAFPIMSMFRIDKYAGRGYTIPPSQRLKVMLSCMALELDSWGDLKDQIAGMYGIKVDDLFDETKDFTLQEAMEQLQGLASKFTTKLYVGSTKGNSFFEIVESFIDTSEFKGTPQAPAFDTENYHYKCVTSGWKSNWVGGKGKTIHYEEGKVISEHDGIYVHKDPLKPEFLSDYWVELKLLDGEAKECPGTGKMKLTGAVRVISQFKNNYCYSPRQEQSQVLERIYNKYVTTQVVAEPCPPAAPCLKHRGGVWILEDE